MLVAAFFACVCSAGVVATNVFFGRCVLNVEMFRGVPQCGDPRAALAVLLAERCAANEVQVRLGHRQHSGSPLCNVPWTLVHGGMFVYMHACMFVCGGDQHKQNRLAPRRRPSLDSERSNCLN